MKNWIEFSDGWTVRVDRIEAFENVEEGACIWVSGQEIEVPDKLAVNPDGSVWREDEINPRRPVVRPQG